MSTKRLGLSFIILATILLGVHTFSRATVVGNTASLSKIEARGVTAQETAAATTSAASPSPTGVLNVFQLSTPVLGSQSLRDAFVGNSTSNATAIDPNASGINCQVTLVRFNFANSFGKPFIGDYAPPDCIKEINTVVMNFTVESKGIQFDRLALMYLGDTEVFRTSTAEPVRNGIRWEYSKDMSHYMSLWTAPQKIIFDLANIVDSNYTGTYNTTLTATFLKAKQAVTPADLIIPISARKGVNSSAASVFSIPTVNATNTVSFPRNANRAVFSISSCGQGAEEFWWSNALQSGSATFEGGTLPGFSPFREVQLYIDGQLAGVQWPFPVIFTGGVVPGLWSPTVGIDAFDLNEYEIDISPWLAMLCDGNQHTFSMQVAGLLDNGRTTATLSKTVGDTWSVTGKIFVWLDPTNSITTGSPPTLSASTPSIAISQSVTRNSTGSNQTLTYTTDIRRTFSASSTIKTQSGTRACSWTQTLSHTDNVTWLDFGNTQINYITTTGIDSSQGATPYSNSYSYPLFANTTAFNTADGGVSLSSLITRSKNITISGSSIYPSGLQVFAALLKSADIVPNFSGTTLFTTQNGTAALFRSAQANASFTKGNSNQMYRFGGISSSGALGMEPDTELYFRSVATVNDTLTRNEERLVGSTVSRIEDGAGASRSLSGQQALVRNNILH